MTFSTLKERLRRSGTGTYDALIQALGDICASLISKSAEALSKLQDKRQIIGNPLYRLWTLSGTFSLRQNGQINV